MIDWSTIRQEYEQGASLRVLALKHGVSKSTIGEHKFKEGWTERTDSNGRTADIGKIMSIHQTSMPSDALTIAQGLLGDLAHLTQGEPARFSLGDHVKASRALSEYVRVLITAPREDTPHEKLSIPLDTISPHTRLAIQRLLAEDEHQEEGVG